MPGTFLLTLQGANVYKGNYVTFFILLGIFLLVGLLMLMYQGNILPLAAALEQKE